MPENDVEDGIMYLSKLDRDFEENGYYISSDKHRTLRGNETSKGGYIKEDMTLYDKDGNKVSFELQAVRNTTGDPYKSSGAVFHGYMLGIINSEIDEEYEKKLKVLGENFIKTHQDEISSWKYIPKAWSDPQSPFYNPKGLYISLMLDKAIEADVKAGTATSLEKAYMYQRKTGKCLSFEQLTGETALGDDLQFVKDLEKDGRTKGLVEEGKENEASANRGEKSLRERMKADSFKANKVIITQENDGQQVMRSSSPQSSIPETFNEDEKNALVRYAIERKQKQQQ